MDVEYRGRGHDMVNLSPLLQQAMKNLIQQYQSHNLIEDQLTPDISTCLVYREITGVSYQYYCPTELNHFIVLLVENGNGISTMDGTASSIAQFQLQLYFPGQFLCCQLTSITKIYEISITAEMFEQIPSYFKHPLSIYKRHPTISLNPDTFYKLVYELRCIHEEIKLKKGLLEIIYFRLRIISLIIRKELKRVLPERHNSISPDPILENFINLINQHCTETRKVGFYAARLFVSANYLNILCRKHYNKTASSVIADEFVQIIKGRLSSSREHIKKISLDLKFCDQSSFSNFFKKHTGISPKVFRDISNHGIR